MSDFKQYYDQLYVKCINSTPYDAKRLIYEEYNKKLTSEQRAWLMGIEEAVLTLQDIINDFDEHERSRKAAEKYAEKAAKIAAEKADKAKIAAEKAAKIAAEKAVKEAAELREIKKRLNWCSKP